eukprot:GCRY01001151.1.p1 GENE.GCRY01001151.1~~GCRY01001151.1.p1  ORF type:complete len:730 (+),score=50.41 GCRY01001151.1:246-2435(+)
MSKRSDPGDPPPAERAGSPLKTCCGLDAQANRMVEECLRQSAKCTGEGADVGMVSHSVSRSQAGVEMSTLDSQESNGRSLAITNPRLGPSPSGSLSPMDVDEGHVLRSGTVVPPPELVSGAVEGSATLASDDEALLEEMDNGLLVNSGDDLSMDAAGSSSPGQDFLPDPDSRESPEVVQVIPKDPLTPVEGEESTDDDSSGVEATASPSNESDSGPKSPLTSVEGRGRTAGDSSVVEAAVSRTNESKSSSTKKRLSSSGDAQAGHGKKAKVDSARAEGTKLKAQKSLDFNALRKATKTIDAKMSKSRRHSIPDFKAAVGKASEQSRSGGLDISTSLPSSASSAAVNAPRQEIKSTSSSSTSGSAIVNPVQLDEVPMAVSFHPAPCQWLVTGRNARGLLRAKPQPQLCGFSWSLGKGAKIPIIKLFGLVVGDLDFNVIQSDLTWLRSVVPKLGLPASVADMQSCVDTRLVVPPIYGNVAIAVETAFLRIAYSRDAKMLSGVVSLIVATFWIHRCLELHMLTMVGKRVFLVGRVIQVWFALADSLCVLPDGERARWSIVVCWLAEFVAQLICPLYSGSISSMVICSMSARVYDAWCRTKHFEFGKDVCGRGSLFSPEVERFVLGARAGTYMGFNWGEVSYCNVLPQPKSAWREPNKKVGNVGGDVAKCCFLIDSLSKMGDKKDVLFAFNAIMEHLMSVASSFDSQSNSATAKYVQEMHSLLKANKPVSELS